ncbi:MAG TPA: response regulator [Pyrinomonadaceae bacterium]
MFSQAQNSQFSSDGRNHFESHSAPQPAAVKQQLILLVEDNTDRCNMLRTLLELWNYRVIEAHNGEEAVRLAKSESPQLILMDVAIPVVDGMEATRRIREFASADKLPVVFISGYAQTGFRLMALACGGNEYLIKPIDFKELEIMLGKYIKKIETTCEWND